MSEGEITMKTYTNYFFDEPAFDLHDGGYVPLEVSDAPEKPLALRLPPGQGRLLRQLMLQMCRTLEQEIPSRLQGPEFKAESERIEKAYKLEEGKVYAALDAFAEARRFALYRENGHLVFTLLGDKGNALHNQ